MGLTTVHATISTLELPRRKAEDTFLVDTGAGYTVIPYKMVKQLKLEPIKKQKFSLADGSMVTRSIGHAMIEFDGNKAPSTVVLGQRGDEALLGTLTFENMGIMVDPFNRKLKPMKLMLG